MLVSENDEENENYAVQDNEILNTKEATANFCNSLFPAWFYLVKEAEQAEK